MSGAPESREAQPEITVSELEQYLQKSIRPSVIPSTFRVVEMEFRRLAEEQSDARILLEKMMIFFRTSHRVVYEKLMGLYDGLYLHPGSEFPEPQRAPSPEVNSLDWDDAGDRSAQIAAATAKARAEMPTLSENDLLEKIYSMPTLAPPPQPPQQAQPIQESVVREIPRRGTRLEAPTVPDMGKTAELAEQIRAEIQFFGTDPKNLPVPAQQEDYEDSDPGFHDRITLVEAPSPELIKKSSYPPPPDESGTTAAGELFNSTEEKWFEDGEKVEEEQ